MEDFLLEQYLLEVQDRALDNLVLEQYDADVVCVTEDEVLTEDEICELASTGEYSDSQIDDLVESTVINEQNKDEERLAKLKAKAKASDKRRAAEKAAKREKDLEKARAEVARRKEVAAKTKSSEVARKKAGVDKPVKDYKPLGTQPGTQINPQLAAGLKSVQNAKKGEASIKEKIAALADRVRNSTGEAKKKAVAALKVAKDYWKQKAAKVNLSNLYNAKTGEQVMSGIKKYGPMAGAAALAGLAAFGAAKLYKKYFSAAGKACNGDPVCMKKYKVAAALKARQGLSSALSSAKDPKSKAKIQAQIAKWNNKIAKMKG